MKEILQQPENSTFMQEMIQKHPLRDAVDAAYPRLSALQRRIAEYLLASYDEAAFLTADDLGRRVGASDSTVVRFATALGYDGYPGLRAALADLVRTRPTHSGRMAEALRRLSKERSPLLRLLDQDLSALSALRRTISLRLIADVARRIRAARTVYVAGMGISRALVHFAAFRLRRQGLRVETITQGGAETWEVLFGLSPRDVVLAFGFFRGYQDIVRALRYARQQGAHTVVFTDTRDSPLAGEADRIVVARRGELTVVNSLVVPMALLNLLTVAVALEAPDDAVRQLRAWDRLREMFEIPPPAVQTRRTTLRATRRSARRDRYWPAIRGNGGD
jgi:DNA-binding MurR/RpiR family transcriptional regulator